MLKDTAVAANIRLLACFKCLQGKGVAICREVGDAAVVFGCLLFK